MQNLLIVLILVEFMVILLLAHRCRRLLSESRENRDEIHRLNAHSRVLERDVFHSESVLRDFKENNKLGVMFFTEEQEENGLFSKAVKVRFKSQITMNGLPLGAASILKEDTFTEIDHKKIEDIIKNYAKPLIEAGIMVLSGDKIGAVKAISAASAKAKG